MKPQIAIMNQSTVVTDAEVIAVMLHLQIQVSRDFAPIWGVDADLKFYKKGTTPPPTAWQLIMFDTADVAGALGYHELTPNGFPLGKVFIKTTKASGNNWTVTASHELLEMLADPNIYLSAFVQSASTTGTLYALEICDAVEDDSLGYDIGTLYKTRVSDFVTPQWFEATSTNPKSKLDFMGHVITPFTLTVNGYISTFDIPNVNGWVDIFGKVPSQHDPVPLVIVPRVPENRVGIRKMPLRNRRKSEPISLGGIDTITRR